MKKTLKKHYPALVLLGWMSLLVVCVCGCDCECDPSPQAKEPVQKIPPLPPSATVASDLEKDRIDAELQEYKNKAVKNIVKEVREEVQKEVALSPPMVVKIEYQYPEPAKPKAKSKVVIPKPPADAEWLDPNEPTDVQKKTWAGDGKWHYNGHNVHWVHDKNGKHLVRNEPRVEEEGDDCGE